MASPITEFFRKVGTYLNNHQSLATDPHTVAANIGSAVGWVSLINPASLHIASNAGLIKPTQPTNAWDSD
jgi:hypothetical protein